MNTQDRFPSGRRRMNSNNSRNGGNDYDNNQGTNDSKRYGEWIQSASLFSQFSCIEMGVVASLFKTQAYLKFAPAKEGTMTSDGIQNYNHDDKYFLLLSPKEVVRFLYHIQAIESPQDEIDFSQEKDIFPKNTISIFPANTLEGSNFSENTSAVYLLNFEDHDSFQANQPSREIGFIAEWEQVGDVLYSPDLKVIESFLTSFLDSISRLDFASVQAMGRGERRGRNEQYSVSSPSRTRNRPPTRSNVASYDGNNQQEQEGNFDDDL